MNDLFLVFKYMLMYDAKGNYVGMQYLQVLIITVLIIGIIKGYGIGLILYKNGSRDILLYVLGCVPILNNYVIGHLIVNVNLFGTRIPYAEYISFLPHLFVVLSILFSGSVLSPICFVIALVLWIIVYVNFLIMFSEGVTRAVLIMVTVALATLFTPIVFVVAGINYRAIKS